MGKFFDVKFLLDMNDKNGSKPEIYIVCSRVRGPGKTTSVCKMAMERAIKTGEKFVLVCRKKVNVGNYASGVLKGVADMCGGWDVVEEVGIRGLFSNIYIQRMVDSEEKFDEDGNPEQEKEKLAVGYVVALRGAYEIKNISSMFVDSWCSIQDEFIAQDDSEYIKDEPVLLQNLHTSLARGHGKSVRYYPHFMMANCVDVLNPYFIAFGMVGQIQPNTRKWRGDGIVYMRYESDVIAKEHADSAFNRAFAGYSRENDFADNSWLVTGSSLVSKPDGTWGNPYYQYNLHMGKTWFRLSAYTNTTVYLMDYGREEGIRTFAVGEPEPGEMTWDAPGIKIRKMLRDMFKSGRLRFRSEQVKRDYMAII